MTKNKLVIKSNNLIEAFCIMNQNECKVIALLISKIKRDRDNFDIQSISVNEFNNLIDIKGSKSHTYLKLFEKELLKKMIEVTFDNGNRLNINWFSHTEYKDMESILEIGFNPKLKEHLLELSKNYTKYSLNIISKFNSYYAIRIYELLKQYEKIGYRNIDICKLKQMLGIKSDQYTRYNDFKRYVILQAQKELKKYADISFKFEEIKQGKKIKAIKFFIFKNTANGKYDNQIESNHIQDIEDMPSEEVQKIIGDFNFRYNGNLNYILTKNLVKIKGIDCVNKCILEFSNYVGNANKVENSFYDFTTKYGTEKAYTKPTTFHNSKPIQATNYDQREYDDDFFNSLYDNVTFTKSDKEK